MYDDHYILALSVFKVFFSPFFLFNIYCLCAAHTYDLYGFGSFLDRIFYFAALTLRERKSIFEKKINFLSFSLCFYDI